EPDADPPPRRLGGPSAPARLPGRRRPRRVLRGARRVADGTEAGLIEAAAGPSGVTISRQGSPTPGEEILTVNFGPHHPSTHGVLRLIVDLDGEVIRKVRPVIGYLHTGIEKTAESLRYQQAVTVTDRWDYLSPLFNNHSY